ASLTAWLTATPPQLVAGQSATVKLTVSNGGEAGTSLVTPRPVPSLESARAGQGPPAVELDRLPGETATVFEWTFATGGPGVLGFAAQVQGAEDLSGRRLATGWVDAPKIRVLSTATLFVGSFTLLPNPGVMPGAFITAVLVIENRGEAAAELTGLEVAEKKSDGRVAGGRSKFSPDLPVELRGHEGRAIIWTYQTGVPGKVSVTVGINAREAATGRAINSAATTNEVAVRDPRVPPVKKKPKEKKG
ncbi:MAG: hypothetical protein AAB368_11590, partial [bacterium]